MGFELILKCIEKNKEEIVENKLWDMYMTQYPHFNKENFVSWEQYYNRAQARIKASNNNKSKEQIAMDSLKILERVRK